MTDGPKKRPKPAGACTRCGMWAIDYGQLDKTHRPCGGYFMPIYRLSPPIVECETCGATGAKTTGPGMCDDLRRYRLAPLLR